jgi:uncharacterized integral membrane protein (TIGR00697 family)
VSQDLKGEVGTRGLKSGMGSPGELGNFRYLELITGVFVGLLIISNLASTRIITFGPLTFDAGTLTFPLTYIIGDLLTETYGFARSRRIIWIAFLSLFLAFICLFIVSLFPAAPDYKDDAAWKAVMGMAPRIALASLLAFLVGEFANSMTLSKLKSRSPGKSPAMRFIVSTLAGQALDTLFFVGVAFLFVLPGKVLIALVYSNYLFKVGAEIILLPLSLYLCRKLKGAEKTDAVDKNIALNPFAWKVED